MTEHNHDHDHNHEEEFEVTTIVFEDEEGNEVLYEEVMRIDGDEAFGKQYILLTEAGIPDDEDEQAEVFAYSFTENEDGTIGELTEVTTDEEWDMIESTFETLMEEEDEEE
jgi:uncharacterized protein YrzB (UPF0473 family)